MRKIFHDKGFADYVYWQMHDRKTLQKINNLLKSIERDGLMKGEGKPEKLKHEEGYSRRIDEKNRLIYDIENDALAIISCKGHYE